MKQEIQKLIDDLKKENEDTNKILYTVGISANRHTVLVHLYNEKLRIIEKLEGILMYTNCCHYQC
jgi:hypothetical protein